MHKAEPYATNLFHGDVGAFGLLARQVSDAFVQQAAHSLEKFHARIAEVVAGGLAHQVFQHRHRGVAEEAAPGVSVGSGSRVFFVHLRSPSFRRSVSYSPTLRARAKGPPWRPAIRCDGAVCRSPPPTRRPS